MEPLDPLALVSEPYLTEHPCCEGCEAIGLTTAFKEVQVRLPDGEWTTLPLSLCRSCVRRLVHALYPHLDRPTSASVFLRGFSCPREGHWVSLWDLNSYLTHTGFHVLTCWKHEVILRRADP